MKNPKYKIGDRLWPVLRYNNPFVAQPFGVSRIVFTEHEILYSYTDTHAFPEFDVHPTKAQADADCAERRRYLGKAVEPR